MARSNPAPAATAGPAVKYQLSKLRDNAEQLFGVSACTFAGATAKLPDGVYTINEIKATIEKWQKKGAK